MFGQIDSGVAAGCSSWSRATSRPGCSHSTGKLQSVCVAPPLPPRFLFRDLFRSCFLLFGSSCMIVRMNCSVLLDCDGVVWVICPRCLPLPCSFSNKHCSSAPPLLFLKQTLLFLKQTHLSGWRRCSAGRRRHRRAVQEPGCDRCAAVCHACGVFALPVIYPSAFHSPCFAFAPLHFIRAALHFALLCFIFHALQASAFSSCRTTLQR
jgi:hypothetical protein